MLFRQICFGFPIFIGVATVQTTSCWPGLPVGINNVWQWQGPESLSSFWLHETQDALAVMQTNYWNGTYWPGTIQWIGAYLNTLVAATDETLTKYPTRHDKDPFGSHPPLSWINNTIERYYDQIRSYFDGEDTFQIFGAAYDDAQWVVLEWLEAIKLIQRYDAYADSDLGREDIAKFAHRAHIFYNIVQNQFNTTLCDGGMTWNPTLAPYKNAITNELFIASSIAMYLYYPGDSSTDPYPSPNYTARTNQTLPPLRPLAAHDPLLLQNAVKEYDWFSNHNFTNAQGLIVDGFHISKGQVSCDQRNEMVYTYNQGVILSGLRDLWEATGNSTYLMDGHNLIGITINATGWNARNSSRAGDWAGLGRNGIMEDYCDAPANCSQDDLIFKGAYFHHFALFCEALPVSKALVPGVTETAPPNLASEHARKCSSYTLWVEHNAHAALSTRN